ncbi:MAG: hypothetical protein ABMA01_20505 [Chthoniobacteraceae bacterium]
MKIVGDHLAGFASGTTDDNEFDLFSRSAFNRYYYSAFLTVRSVLKRLDPAWAAPSHQAVPEVLKGEVLKRLKRHIRNAQKSGQISETKGNQIYHTAGTAASELSNLLTSAREIRRLADYEPETRVAKQSVNILLGKCTLAAASNWEQRVQIQSKTILKIYADLGII